VKARAAELIAPRRRAASGGGRRYSRFVYLAKLALPAIAVGLLLMIAAWPRLEGAFETVRIAVPLIDLSDASDLRMVNARFTGIDKQSRPFVITAAIARQKPNLDGLITLERPKGDLTTLSGNWLELSSDTGFYEPQPQHLDLFGNVALFQDKGNEFHSSSAHVDMNLGTADGDDPMSGQGPFGHVIAQGFRILDRGDTIVFKGHTQLDVDPRARTQ
jgi:lipopolysaccharide export system protein LptC